MGLNIEFKIVSVGYMIIMFVLMFFLEFENVYVFFDFSGFVGNIYNLVIVIMFDVDFFIGGDFSNLLIIEKIDFLSFVFVDMILFNDGKVFLIFGGCV